LQIGGCGEIRVEDKLALGEKVIEAEGEEEFMNLREELFFAGSGKCCLHVAFGPEAGYASIGFIPAENRYRYRVFQGGFIHHHYACFTNNRLDEGECNVTLHSWRISVKFGHEPER
jgi:hypothetical protein